MARRTVIQKKRPLIVICSEDGKKSTEYCYFRNYANRNLRIQFSTGNSTDPKGMLKDLLKYIDNEDIKSEDNVRVFLVLDTDLDDDRIAVIKSIKQECIENNIEIITSAPTFEIWYLLHYRSNKLKFSSSRDVKKELSQVVGSYNETMDMYSKIEENTMVAKKRAKDLDKKSASTQKELYYYNPHTSIYKILDAIDEFTK